MIRNVVFDLGGVLVDWNPRYVFKEIFVTDEAVEYFLDNICTNRWNEQQDAGRSFKDGTEYLVKEFPHYESEIKVYYSKWSQMLKGDIPETVNLLLAIKSCGNYRLLALTNWADESFPVALDRFDFLQWFDGILVSGTEMMIKPDPEIFELLMRRYQIKAEETLFIDDNINNINTAKKLGFHVVHFNNVALNIEEIQKALNII